MLRDVHLLYLYEKVLQINWLILRKKKSSWSFWTPLQMLSWVRIFPEPGLPAYHTVFVPPPKVALSCVSRRWEGVPTLPSTHPPSLHMEAPAVPWLCLREQGFKKSQAMGDLDMWPWPISTLLGVTNRVTDPIQLGKHLSNISAPTDFCLFYKCNGAQPSLQIRVICISRQKGRF